MAAGGTIQGGGGAIIFLMLDLGKDQAPGAIEHSLHVLDEQGGAHDVALAPSGFKRTPECGRAAA
jgi:hypothetical protein